MRLHPRIPRPRSIAALVMSVGIGGVASLALVTDASAHANTVSGTAACQTNGTFTVTWTVSNDWTLSDHVTEVGATGGGSITGLPGDITASPGTTGKLAHQPFSTITVTQTGVPGTATNASLTVAGKWSDGKTQASSKGGVALSGNCGGAQVGGTAAVAPTFTDTTCTAVTGSYTIPPASTVANYFVALNNGAATAASAGTVSVPAGTTVTISAVGKNGVVLTPPTSWTHTFALATGCSNSPPAGGSSSPAPPGVVVPSTVTPAAPTITQSSCSVGKISTPFISIPGITGVNYFNGATVVPAGNLAVVAGSITTITAGPIAGFTIAGGSTTTWTMTATLAPTVCAAAPSSVLGVTFTKPPAKPPVAVLPFTGMPLVPTTLFGFALLLAGTLLIGSSRRHRFSRLIPIDRASRRS